MQCWNLANALQKWDSADEMTLDSLSMYFYLPIMNNNALQVSIVTPFHPYSAYLVIMLNIVYLDVCLPLAEAQPTE